jgi:ribosomal protein S18 acetylase RimI-like enzyme
VAGEIRIEEATDCYDGLLEVVERLVRQLSRSSPAPSPAELEELIGSPASHLLLARDDDDTVVGMLTLAVFRVPTGLRAWIEDVVLDEAVRGRVVGAELTNAAIHLANQRGARTVDLTSRPSREAANRLYQRLGFVQRETNVYRFDGSI